MIPEDKQGQKAWRQAPHGGGGVVVQHRCSIAPVGGLQGLHPNGAWEKRLPSVILIENTMTSINKSKALCPTLCGWWRGEDRARPTEASGFPISLPSLSSGLYKAHLARIK